MKKFIILVIVVLAAASAAMGQSSTYFSSGEECVNALQNGTAKFYKPTYFKLYKPVSAGEELRGLESNACVNMLTVKGYQWVAQAEGMQMVFRGRTILRRYDCGNPIKDVRYPGVKPPADVVVPPTPQCPEGTEPSETPGLCIQKVTNTVTKTEYVDKPVPVATCPANLSVVGKVRWKDRLTGQWIQKAVSFGGSMIGSKIAGQDWRGSALDGAKGVALQAGQQAVNAPEGLIVISGAGLNNEKIKKGENRAFSNGLSVEWKNDTAVIYNQVLGQNYACFGYRLKETSNLGIWITDRQVLQEVINQVPTKTVPTTGSPVPIPPTGQLPGGGVPVTPGGNTVPTRPTRNNQTGFAPGWVRLIN